MRGQGGVVRKEGREAYKACPVDGVIPNTLNIVQYSM